MPLSTVDPRLFGSRYGADCLTGEIYDYERLRAEMVEKQNYAFRGHSDCELVLALWVANANPSMA
jgi:asparagine synthetase B (glutamine-hydrolysing)